MIVVFRLAVNMPRQVLYQSQQAATCGTGFDKVLSLFLEITQISLSPINCRDQLSVLWLVVKMSQLAFNQSRDNLCGTDRYYLARLLITTHNILSIR